MTDKDECRCGDGRGTFVSDVIVKSPHLQFINYPHLKVMKGSATSFCSVMSIVVFCPLFFFLIVKKCYTAPSHNNLPVFMVNFSVSQIELFF